MKKKKWKQIKSIFILNSKIPFVAVEDEGASMDIVKLSAARMKLEEKRRQIENDKRKAEDNLKLQQEQVGKAAFLQAIHKVSDYFPFIFRIETFVCRFQMN